MKKSEKERRENVIEKLKHQEIRDVKDLESYKLSTYHPASAGIDLGSRSNYVAINLDIAVTIFCHVASRRCLWNPSTGSKKLLDD